MDALMATNKQLQPALSVYNRKAMHHATQPVPTHKIRQCDQLAAGR